MSSDKQIDEMAKAKKCNVCIHNVVCEKLEEFHDPLGWVDVKGDFCCSYYENPTDVAREIFVDVMKAIEKGVANANATVKSSTQTFAFREVLLHTGEMYSGHIGKTICEVFKKYESEGADDGI